MTTVHATAHVYYRDHGRTPDFVLVIRDTQSVPTQLADAKIVETGDDHLAIIGRALADIGWLPADPMNARIVRQADGLGHLPVISVQPDTDEPDPVAARISIEANGTLGQVTVGGNVRALPPDLVWTAYETPDRIKARAAIDRNLIDLGYIRIGPVRPTIDGLTADVEPAEWRDHPTLVRVDDITATLLTRAADNLGIPADNLASTWITRAANDALNRQARMQADIVDHSRIRGWLPDGCPDLINTGTMPPGRHGSGGSGA